VGQKTTNGLGEKKIMQAQGKNALFVRQREDIYLLRHHYSRSMDAPLRMFPSPEKRQNADIPFWQRVGRRALPDKPENKTASRLSASDIWRAKLTLDVSCCRLAWPRFIPSNNIRNTDFELQRKCQKLHNKSEKTSFARIASSALLRQHALSDDVQKIQNNNSHATSSSEFFISPTVEFTRLSSTPSFARKYQAK
jgi:hypothetical protein